MAGSACGLDRYSAIARSIRLVLTVRNNSYAAFRSKTGAETATYVSNIYKYYVAYKLVAETNASKKPRL